MSVRPGPTCRGRNGRWSRVYWDLRFSSAEYCDQAGDGSICAQVSFHAVCLRYAGRAAGAATRASFVADRLLSYHPGMEIRDAVAGDAPATCQVLTRSISELCVADHGNDPAILTQWLSNKTPGIVASWIANPDSSMLVAIEEGTILGVGSVTNAGHITLNYVSPDARFRGVSRALLSALEVRSVARGNARCTLSSTETARAFYLANGYVIDGPPDQKWGMGGYPMSKLLTPPLRRISLPLPWRPS
jgi:GNAT superfamily N-acetyltransferase